MEDALVENQWKSSFPATEILYMKLTSFHLGLWLIEGGYTFTGALRPATNLSMRMDSLRCVLSVIDCLQSHGNRKIIAKSILLIQKHSFNVTP